MRRLVIQGALLLSMLVCAAGAPAWAQNREKAWEINPYAGFLTFDKVKGETVLKDKWDIGLRFGYHWTKHQLVEFGFFGASTDNPGQDLKVDLLGGSANYTYNFFLQHRGKVVAYATGGIGMINISSFGLAANPDLVGDRFEKTLNYGGGIRFFGGPRAGFRIDVRRSQFTDQSVDIHYIEISTGMTIVLGGIH